ncbi:hypothetical protein BE20_52095 [Sorangium cellulosum]|uniref:Uncharacterized protein n=1 Tax=Sorangium cellulosum TaxID=56 RepID=A0A150TB55_SORCE|nr:hypothetical protein BE18_37855 [Sorangium cellulosum]KYG01935.1 hypothetical protein BE20_52095 [Sorangium cellulosum]
MPLVAFGLGGEGTVRTLYLSLLVGGVVLGCGGSKPQPEGPAEKAGEAVDDAARDVKDEAKDAAESTGDAAEEAGDKVEDKTD